VLEHKDSLGTGATIKTRLKLQRMGAGTGHSTHSGFNPRKQIPVHLLQIWLLPDTDG
jgi:hypothetical protein